MTFMYHSTPGLRATKKQRSYLDDELRRRRFRAHAEEAFALLQVAWLDLQLAPGRPSGEHELHLRTGYEFMDL